MADDTTAPANEWEHNDPKVLTTILVVVKDLVVRTNPACWVNVDLNETTLTLCELLVAKLGWVAGQRRDTGR